MKLLHTSKIEETLLFKIVWDFFSDIFLTLVVFGTALFFAAINIGLAPELILSGLLIGGLAELVINQIKVPYARFIGGLLPAIMTSLIILLYNYDNQVILEFMIILILYSFLNSLLQEPVNNPDLHANIFLYLLLNIFRFVGILVVMFFLKRTIPEVSYQTIKLLNGEVVISQITFFMALSFATIMIALMISSTQLLLLKKELLSLSRKLKNISSWSFDQEIIEKKMLNGDTKIVESNKIILIGDIRGFTKFTSRNSLKFVVRMLKNYYTKIEECISETDGFKPEFIADEFITFFDSTETALECALIIRERLQEFLKQYNLSLGMGIAKGSVLEGLIGGNQSKKYTLVGKAINMAARLQEHARDGQILVTKGVIKSLPANIAYHKIEGLTLKGVERIHTFYEIIGYAQELHTQVKPQKNGMLIRLRSFGKILLSIFSGNNFVKSNKNQSRTLQSN